MTKKPAPATQFYPLPLSVQRPILGGCQCSYCREHPHSGPPMWDTLAVDPADPRHTWTVHYPELRWKLLNQ